MFRSGKLWLLFLIIIIIVNSNFFIIVAGLEKGEHLGDILAGSLDYPTYLTKMKIGFEGGWQYINRYTTEAHNPSYIFMFYILLGHVVRVLGLDIAWTYHVVRILLSFMALGILYKFLAKYSGSNKPLMLFILAVFISGTFSIKLDLAPQYHIFSGMMGFAHYPLTLSCLLIFFDSTFDYAREKGIKGLIKAVIALNVLAIVHPFMVVLAGLVATATVILNGNFRASLPLLAVSALSVTPGMLYFYYVFSHNPVLMGWRQQATDAFSLINIILFGIASIYAYGAVFLIFLGKLKRTPLLSLSVSWLTIGLVLSYTSLISSSLQWLFFSSLPIACLSWEFINYLEKTGVFQVKIGGRSVVTRLLICFPLLPSLIFLIFLDVQALSFVSAKEEHSNIFINKRDMQCLQWLDENAGQGDIVLTDSEWGLLIPVFTGSLSYLGHHHETLQYKEKKEQVERALSRGYPEGLTEIFLFEKNIKYILIPLDTGKDYKFLEQVCQGDSLTLYQYKGVK